jgi:hypothetical protein
MYPQATCPAPIFVSYRCAEPVPHAIYTRIYVSYGRMPVLVPHAIHTRSLGHLSGTYTITTGGTYTYHTGAIYMAPIRQVPDKCEAINYSYCYTCVRILLHLCVVILLYIYVFS